MPSGRILRWQCDNLLSAWALRLRRHLQAMRQGHVLRLGRRDDHLPGGHLFFIRGRYKLQRLSRGDVLPHGHV